MVSISRRKRSFAASAAYGGKLFQSVGLDPIRRISRKDQTDILTERPDAGRSTRLGRKVETPASITTAGPSGQRDGSQHQKQHTNK